MMQDTPRGYKTVIYPGLWKVIVSKIGIPKKWMTIVMMVGMLEGLGGVKLLGWYGLVVGIICFLIQFGLLVWLTAIDIQFDDLHVARWGRRYKSFYTC